MSIKNKNKFIKKRKCSLLGNVAFPVTWREQNMILGGHTDINNSELKALQKSLTDRKAAAMS
jgi:hypothetical protein